MNDHHIEKFDDLIYEYTGRRKIILKTDVSNLTAPGENYCSLMLKIDVTLKDLESGEEGILNTVAKCMSKGIDSYFGKLAFIQFKKEIGFYSEVVPALQEFQREQGVEAVLNIYPKVLAFRRNLHGNDKSIDENAVIIFENLKVQGFDNIERRRGFNLDEAKVILKDIAAFHAVPVALKLRKPEVFESTVKIHCSIEDLPKYPKAQDEQKMPIWLEVATKSDKCKDFVPKLNKQLIKFMDRDDIYAKSIREPFASIAHNDLWINNTMPRFQNDKIIDNKIIDFQLYQYANPFLDLVFFIYSSVQREVVKDNFENLILLYEEHFFRILKDLKCDINSLERNFLKEVTTDAPNEIFHLLFMAVPIFGRDEESAVDLAADPHELIKESFITEEATVHIAFVIEEYAKRGWI